MKKFLKKNKKTLADLVVYFVMLIIGLITMLKPEIGFNKPNTYSAILFFIVAFFSFGGYFYMKESKKDYELLYLSLISMISAAYLFIFDYTTVSYILATGFLAFTLLTMVNRVFHIDLLRKENNSLWILRSISLILILFLSILTIQNFYREVSEVQVILVGYHFISFGLISFIEILLLNYIKPESFEKFINGDFEEPKVKKLKKVNKFNENVDKLDEIVKNIEAPKRKKKKVQTKKKVTKKINNSKKH